MLTTHRSGFTLKVFFSLSSALIQALKNPLGNNPVTEPAMEGEVHLRSSTFQRSSAVFNCGHSFPITFQLTSGE